MKPPIKRFVDLCLAQSGERYVFGAEVNEDGSIEGTQRWDCCLVGDSLVYTTDGPVPISEIEEGTSVLSWDEGVLTTQKVVARLDQPVQSIYKVRTRNRTVRASGNHPFLALRYIPGSRNVRGQQGHARKWRTEWVRADELKRDDIIVTLDHGPLPTEPVSLVDGTLVDHDVAWLLGLILGDGYATPTDTRICVYGDTRERAAHVLKRVWNTSCAFNEQHGVIAGSKVLADTLRAEGYTYKSRDKRIPEVARKFRPDLLRAFLAGYAEADGHFDKRGHQSYSSASRRLVAEVRALHIMLGDSVSNLTVTRRIHPIFIKGKRVKDAADLWSFAAYPDSNRRGQTVLDSFHARSVISDRRFGAERVLAVEPDGVEATYDIEIEGTHNFVAEGVVVHNSELVQVCAHKAGGYMPDGSSTQRAYCRDHGTLVSIERAYGIYGALLFIQTSSHHHVAVSLGNGKTIEARGSAYGVGSWDARRRGWTSAGLIPSFDYSAGGEEDYLDMVTKKQWDDMVAKLDLIERRTRLVLTGHQTFGTYINALKKKLIGK
jgi:intein/homing endonuclease